MLDFHFRCLLGGLGGFVLGQFRKEFLGELEMLVVDLFQGI
jgi:hypothetical protein